MAATVAGWQTQGSVRDRTQLATVLTESLSEDRHATVRPDRYVADHFVNIRNVATNRRVEDVSDGTSRPHLSCEFGCTLRRYRGTYVYGTFTTSGKFIFRERCFGEFGCFKNRYPFWSIRRPISLLPQSNATSTYSIVSVCCVRVCDVPRVRAFAHTCAYVRACVSLPACVVQFYSLSTPRQFKPSSS